MTHSVSGCLGCTAIGKPAVPRGSPVRINAAGDTKPQQHPLDYREVIVVALREADANAFLLIPLDAAVSIEQAAQEAGTERAGPALDG